MSNETTYVPDPRPTPLVTALSRNYGAVVYQNLAPSPPANRRKPAVSYTAAGAVSVWDTVSGSWIAITAGSSSSTPSEIGSAGEPSYAADYFDSYSVGALASLTGGYGWGANGVVSGASIISATMADGRIHKRLALNNGSIGRAMPWGAFWNRIIIAMTVRINSGVTFTNTNGYIGVCFGTANMVDSVANTANFVGVRWGDGTGTSTFTAGTKINFFDVPSFRACTRRTNTTVDKGGLSSGHTISANGGYLSTIAVDISRPVFALDADSINYSVAESSSTQTTVQFSHEKDVVERILKSGDYTGVLLSANVIGLMGASGVTATPFAFDQSTGVFDTLNIYWPQAFNLEIASLAIRKVF